MKEKIKTSWRFRIANWILGGTLMKALNEVITNLEMFLTISRWPTEPDVYMTVEPLEEYLLIKVVRVLLNHLMKYETTFRFKLANFVCKHELLRMLKNTMHDIYDTVNSIDYKSGSAGLKDIDDIRLSLRYAKCIMDI